MDIEALRTTIIDFIRLNAELAPFVVGLLAFGESVAVVSLFVPATVILFGIGALVGGMDIAFWPIWVGAAVGALLGDWLSYEFGRYFEDNARTMWPLNRYGSMIDKGEKFTRKYGVLGVFFGRFLGPVRAVVPLAAGIFAMARAPFLTTSTASAIVWAYVLLTSGDVAGQAGTWLLRYFQS